MLVIRAAASAASNLEVGGMLVVSHWHRAGHMFGRAAGSSGGSDGSAGSSSRSTLCMLLHSRCLLLAVGWLVSNDRLWSL
jgi:hypothetical protein